MHRYQRAVDAYDADYVQRHLIWRSHPTLRLLAEDPRTSGATRQFVHQYLDAGRLPLRDGQPG